MQYGLIGERLGHSFSREIHGMLSQDSYVLKELRPDELAAFLRRRDFRGINVTIPYKQAVMPLLDSLDPSAELSGAVNTIVNDGGRLRGYNTDFGGFLAMADKAGISFAGARVLVLGRGGAARAVSAAVRSRGAESVSFAVREPRTEGEVPMSEPGPCDILVNATPVGMYPDVLGCPLDISALSELRGVLDCVYNPLRTPLVLSALERGIPAAGGLYMLVSQAVLAREHFGGTLLPEGVTDEIYGRVLAARRNIVLCGMPSSGKSTIGRELAYRLGRPFVDLDEVISTLAGAEIPEIFRREGEEGFRKRETAAIESIASAQGQVIATGGGAVLREENVRMLRLNGLLCLLDRRPGLLVATDDRPLSRSREALELLYDRRRAFYEAAAEVRIDNNGEPEEALRQLLEHAGQEY